MPIISPQLTESYGLLVVIEMKVVSYRRRGLYQLFYFLRDTNPTTLQLLRRENLIGFDEFNKTYTTATLAVLLSLSFSLGFWAGYSGDLWQAFL